MYKAKITSKGQITIPAGIRKAMGVKPGEKVVFFEGEDGEFRLQRMGSIKDLEGCLKGLVPPMTIEEMDKAIGEAATQSYLKSIGRLPLAEPSNDSKDEAA